MDIGEATYMNAGLLAKGLKASGHKGYSVLDIQGLCAAGTASCDREVYWKTGTGIIIPAPFTGDWKNYNVAVSFGISFNNEGVASDNDDWIDFNTAATPNSNYLQAFQQMPFFNFTVRNNTSQGDLPNIRLYILQNPFYITQLNKLLKDIVR